MAITNIKLSFLKCEWVLGRQRALYFHNNAWGGYDHIIRHIVLNLALIAKDVLNNEKWVNGKSIEQCVCFAITHEELHHWLSENEGLNASIAFDTIAERFMGGM